MPEPEDSIYLEAYGAVYVEIAKVASSSLKVAFADLMGLDLEAAGGNPHEIDFPHPPRPAEDGDRFYPGLITFAFVRNPWDRLVSCYRDKVRGEAEDFTGFAASGVAHCLAGFDVFTADMSFEDFVHAVAAIPDDAADDHFRSQHTYLTNSSGEVAVDFVGRFENLDSDLSKVAGLTGLPLDLPLPRLQAVGRPRRYADFYTAATRNAVARRYARDIELFSYRFG
jgi:hypothetical protein